MDTKQQLRFAIRYIGKQKPRIGQGINLEKAKGEKRMLYRINPETAKDRQSDDNYGRMVGLLIAAVVMTLIGIVLLIDKAA